MNTNYIIKKAILSEKAYALMESGIYTFLVDTKAKKDDVKKAVEAQFGTKVVRINVMGKAAKNKRVTGTRKFTSTGAGKKAIVYLAAGQNIAMLSPKKESKDKSKKVTKESIEPKETQKKGLLSRIGKSKPKKEKEKESN